MLTYANINPAVNQIEVHPYCQQSELIEFCKKVGIVVTAYSPLSSPNRAEAGVSGGPPSCLIDPVITDIAKNHSCTPAQVCLAWASTRDYVFIPKTSSVDRVKENLGSLDILLSQDELAKITSIDMGEKGRGFNPRNGWDEFGCYPLFS